MKYIAAVCLVVVWISGNSGLFAQANSNAFAKKDFYTVMAGKDKKAIDQQLGLLQSETVTDKSAYEGALLMKKAGFASGPKKKLDLFKQGHKKLEAVLEKDSSNAEFRFLRLMIQEHAPGILGYKKNMESDKAYIKNNFKKLQPVVREAVQDYAKESKILTPADL